MAKPTILLVIEGTYPWYRGGVSEWVHQYINHFKFADFQLLQVATDQYLNSKLDEALYAVPGHVRSFERVAPPELNKSWDREAGLWLEEVKGCLGKYERVTDLVHIANTGFAGWLGMKIAHHLFSPLILTEHALYWKEVDMGAVALECGYKIPDTEGEKNRMTEMFRELAVEIYGASDEVVSVSKCNMENQLRFGANNPHYIPNGVESSWFTEEKAASKSLTIGWIGRCAEMKNPLGFLDLVDAFRERDSHRGEYIMMACEANEAELQLKLEERLSDYPEVEFYWNKPAESHLHRMDALCITSHNESQPLVLFEAIAKKVLPIGWRAGDVTEEYGLIVSRDMSPAGLAEKVETLWNNRKAWEKKVEKLHQIAKRKHTWPVIFEQYRQLFEGYQFHKQ